ncbi:hypothetical protein Cgig2_029102 [Carnegiea gigantea]|uniref:Uncharacterized protein n=1 Tax=Carnegiea gigantea TaxID=171969 RepID=A0A9Q1GN75_9CARY|nr:hypothetical protein Cgig2_029102 [Carnegiea gigantea]
MEQGSRVTAPTMVFGGKDTLRGRDEDRQCDCAVNPGRIGSSVDIITWDYLKRLMHPGRDLVPMANPILGFEGQEVNPTRMICLPVRFGDKNKFKSLEVDFLVVDVPTAYNVIIGRPTLHRVKAVMRRPQLLRDWWPHPQQLTLGRRKYKLHFLRIATLYSGPLKLDHKVQVCLQPLTASLISRDVPLQPTALCDRLYPFGKDISYSHLLLGDLWGVRSPRGCQVPGFDYILDKREPDAFVRFDEVGERPRGATYNWSRDSYTFVRSLVRLPGRSLLPWRPAPRLVSKWPVGRRLPHLRRNGCLGLARVSLSPLLLADRQAHSGPLPAGSKGGCLQEKVYVYVPREIKEGRIRSYTIPFWPAGQQGAASLPSTYA